MKRHTEVVLLTCIIITSLGAMIFGQESKVRIADLFAWALMLSMGALLGYVMKEHHDA